MKKSAVVLVLLSIFSYGYTQEIHSPVEILKLLSNSKLRYDIKMLDKPITGPDYSVKLNYSDSYRVVSDSSINTYFYKPNDLATQKFQKAEIYFQAKDYENALIWYKSTLEADSSYFLVMNYIGQVYEINKDHKNAIFWYKKAISKNYIDYMSHWFLADNYKSINDLTHAVDEIVIARILNRNNPRIKKSFDAIFLRAKRDTSDWYFNPQIEISKPSENTINLAMNDKWFGYGMPKALWMYEPGYSESMGATKGQHTILEDRECLISMVIAQTNAKAKIKGIPEFTVLKQAAENKHLDDYIFFEIILPKNPAVAYQLPEKSILEIKDYILDVRNKKK
ncbi:MAG: tetratricopeptide repeat protein [Paludibacter sp.]|nr:tetratricopeptide repeat protein [Paludibacter sp.]